jgi:hypothetical protein
MRYSHPTHIRKFNLLVTLDLGSDLVNPVGDFLRGGSTVLTVELDSEIVIGSTGVVGSGQQDPTVVLARIMADTAGVERMVASPMMRCLTSLPAASRRIFWTTSGDY